MGDYRPLPVVVDGGPGSADEKKDRAADCEQKQPIESTDATARSIRRCQHGLLDKTLPFLRAEPVLMPLGQPALSLDYGDPAIEEIQ